VIEVQTQPAPSSLVPDEILQLRLANQHLASQQLDDPTELVAQLGAVQAQDYPAAKWALGMRLLDGTDALLEDAFAEGKILRTHVLRPTWHFVAPADIRWILALTAPRIKAAMTPYALGLGLDEALFARCEAVIVRALGGGRSLTRAELGAALRQAGIEIHDGATVGHIVSRGELDALVCSGPRHGLQHTYALLEERVPPAPSLSGQEALAELTWRYFSSHGPALARDCSWWSGLPVGQITRGLELNSWRLERETVDGRTYWFRRLSPPPTGETAYLLPNYDEYTVAYRERDLFYDRARNWTGNPRIDVPFSNVIVVGGHVVGRWKRVLRNGAVTIESQWSGEPSDDARRALAAAAERYGAFFRPSLPG
jgi:hypothetical protein